MKNPATRFKVQGSSKKIFLTPYTLYLTPRAFTLIETMVAITILTLSIVGPMYAANRAIVAARSARDQLTASYLAQEGIEYVRAVRDDAFLFLHPASTNGAWNNFKSSLASCRTSTINTAPFCTYEPTDGGSLSICPSGDCSPLYLRSEGIYTQESDVGNTQTIFTRTIQSKSVTSNDEQIVSKVSWSYHDTLYSVTISTHLTPWQ